jgi:CheY-like chemotaxis protein
VKILVVDDSESCRYLLSVCLEQKGHQVRVANNMPSALEVLADFIPELLITDWRFDDGSNGLEVAEALKKEQSQLKIIFMSGMPEDYIQEVAGNFDYLKIIRKPLNMLEVAGLVHETLQID